MCPANHPANQADEFSWMLQMLSLHPDVRII
jgi:hypothetical protein